jgi:nucleoid-associated protein YgaU
MPDQKAEIFRVDDPSKKVSCQFNPKDFSISKSVKWVYQTADGKNVGNPEFAGGEAQDLTVELMFDSTDTGADVRAKYQELLKMAEIDTAKANTKTRKGEPPECKFQWGSFLSFTGVIKTIGQNFILFKGDGTPLRARVKVTFSETAHATPGQNPTTRTESRKVWTVREGESLSWIAYKEYGDPACWRHIAETNNLDNPLELVPGTVLKLVPLP